MKYNFLIIGLVFFVTTVVFLGTANLVFAVFPFCTTNADCASTPNTPTCFSIDANDPSQCTCGFDTTSTSIPCSGGGAFGVKVDNPLSNAGINDPNSLVQKILDFVAGLITSLAGIVMVYGGILYVFSAGNEARLATAKKCLIWAIVGLAIGLAGNGILTLIEEVFKV